jgi:hypothetical protein
MVATNIVRTGKDTPLVDARRAPRVRVAQRAWLCGVDGSIRGYALDLSVDGGRFGGTGMHLEVGTRLIVKLLLDEREPPLVLRAEVKRYATALNSPHLCLRFTDAADGEKARLAAFVYARRN